MRFLAIAATAILGFLTANAANAAPQAMLRVAGAAQRGERERRDRVTSARILGDMLNDLPRDRVASVAERDAVYQQVVASRNQQAGGPLSAEAVAGAQAALDGCSYIKDEEMWYHAFETRISRYRSCIGFRHDRLIKEVNETYWDRVKSPGM